MDENKPVSISSSDSKATPVNTSVRKERKPLNVFSVVLSVLFILALGGLVYFYMQSESSSDRIASLKTQLETLENGGESVDTQSSDEDSDDTKLVDDVDFAEVDTTGWTTYTNENMGFSIKYPKSYAMDDEYVDDIALTIVETSLGGEEAVNCVKIGPVNGGPTMPYEERLAILSFGYDPSNGSPNACFLSGTAASEIVNGEEDMQLGDEVVTLTKQYHLNEYNMGDSFLLYTTHLDNPVMDPEEYNYFAVEMRFIMNYEGKYLDLYKDILTTFEWLD